MGTAPSAASASTRTGATHPTAARFREAVERGDLDAARAPIFRARVGERELEGIDLLRFDADGLISDFTVMLRPLSGLVPFAQAMAERAAQAGIHTTPA